MFGDSAVSDIVNSFASKGTFDGIGLVKNFVHKIAFDDSIQPVSSPPRKLPPAILTQVKDSLDKLCADGIIKAIDEPTDWCSLIVVARKKNGDIQICTNLRNVNRAVKRPVYPILDINNILSHVEHSSIYSLLDCTSAFHQIPIHADSQKLFTFAAPMS